jgi:hypothetical protein
MSTDTDYQDDLDDTEIEFDDPLIEEFVGTRSEQKDRDCRRAIEELREEKRLRELLTDYDLDDDL